MIIWGFSERKQKFGEKVQRKGRKRLTSSTPCTALLPPRSWQSWWLQLLWQNRRLRKLPRVKKISRRAAWQLTTLRANPYSLGFGQKNWDYRFKMLWIVCVAKNYHLFLSFYLVSIRNLASKLQKSWFCVVNLANFEKVPDGGRWYTKIWI